MTTTTAPTMTVEQAEEAIIDARTSMLLDHSPYFGMLALRLKPVPKNDGALSVDGTRLFFNPEAIASLTQAELVSEIARAVMTCANRLPYRMQGRDAKLWNQAANNVIYPLLKDAGFTLRADAPVDSRFADKDMATEDVYAILEEEQHQQQQQQRQTGGNSGQDQDGADDQQQQGGGQQPPQQSKQQGKQNQKQPKSNPLNDDFCQQAPEPDNQPSQGDQPGQSQPDDQQQPGESETGAADQSQDGDLTETDWQIASEQVAAITRKAGTMPGNIDRNLQAGRETQTDWRDTLRRFMQQVLPTDYCWSRPNKRFIADGLYLAGVLRENMPKIAFANDTSGSVSSRYQQLVGDECTQILHELKPDGLDVYHGDTRVTHVDYLTPDDIEVKLNAKGGGGTLFKPLLDAIENAGEEYKCILFFSEDLYASDWDKCVEPEIPVLWIVPEFCEVVPPFGEVVKVQLDRR